MIPGDFERGVVPVGTYAQEKRSPILWALLCAGCAGFAPFTDVDYQGFLSGRCQACGRPSREMHRFRAYIASDEGCSCADRHGKQMVGDMGALPAEVSDETVDRAAFALHLHDGFEPEEWEILPGDPDAHQKGYRAAAAACLMAAFSTSPPTGSDGDGKRETT